LEDVFHGVDIFCDSGASYMGEGGRERRCWSLDCLTTGEYDDDITEI